MNEDNKMNIDIELSVIVPVFNVAPYLERCLDSILNQTYPVGEIICVNDGSTDRSLEILHKYEKNEERIKVISQNNQGLVSARKKGLSVAKGKYAAYVDSDDWIENNMYAEMLKLAAASDADIVTSGCIRDYGNHCIYESENISAGIYKGKQLTNELLAKMIAVDEFFCANIDVHIFNKVYKRDLLTKYQNQVDDRISVAEDGACIYPCLLNSEIVAVSGQNYYHYCIRDNSMMSVTECNKDLHLDLVLSYLSSEFKKKTPMVSNLLRQLQQYAAFMYLLKDIEKVVKYEDGVLYPFTHISSQERVVIYGAGRFGNMLRQYLVTNHICELVAIVDKKGGVGIYSIQDMIEKDIKYQKIIVAVLKNDVKESAIHDLIAQGVSSDLIYCIDPDKVTILQ